MSKAKLSISIDGELLTRLDRLAAERGRNRSEIIEMLCRGGVDSELAKGSDAVEYIRLFGNWFELEDLIRDAIGEIGLPHDAGVELVVWMHRDRWIEAMKFKRATAANEPPNESKRLGKGKSK